MVMLMFMSTLIPMPMPMVLWMGYGDLGRMGGGRGSGRVLGLSTVFNNSYS